MERLNISNLIKQRDKSSKDYNNFYRKTHPHFKEELRKIISALNPKESETIFDAGCGTGFFSRYISKYFKKLYGVDYSEKSIEIFKKQNILNTELKTHDLTIPLKVKNKFDKAVSIQVIQHIPTEKLRIKALKNIKDLLKEGGIFVCELQDWNSPSRIFKRIRSKLKHGFNSGRKELILENFYIYKFSPNEFLELLKKAEFKNNEIVSKAKGGYFITRSEK
jgi:SAM-dependent methyltransferase